jgi:hypothetical protein
LVNSEDGVVRRIPKICLDYCNTNLSLLELIRTALKDALGIEGRFSSQKDTRSNRKVIYQLRIYRKDVVRKFLLNVETPKLKREKMKYVENWLQEKKERKEVEITS